MSAWSVEGSVKVPELRACHWTEALEGAVEALGDGDPGAWRCGPGPLGEVRASGLGGGPSLRLRPLGGEAAALRARLLASTGPILLNEDCPYSRVDGAASPAAALEPGALDEVATAFGEAADGAEALELAAAAFEAHAPGARWGLVAPGGRGWVQRAGDGQLPEELLAEVIFVARTGAPLVWAGPAEPGGARRASAALPAGGATVLVLWSAERALPDAMVDLASVVAEGLARHAAGGARQVG
jgi:hypothetical protein